MVISDLLSHFLGPLNIPFLRSIRAANKQDVNLASPKTEIQTITRPVVDPKFTNSIKDFDVPNQTISKVLNPGRYQASGFSGR